MGIEQSYSGSPVLEIEHCYLIMDRFYVTFTEPPAKEVISRAVRAGVAG